LPATLHHRKIALCYCLIGLIIFLLASCKSTKYVPEESHLLKSYKVKVDKEQVDSKELDSYIKPKPNRLILGTKFYLGLYNLSGEKDSGWNRWLRKIGESPVLYDDYETERNNKQLRLYMRNKGYHHAEVSDSVRFNKKKAQVSYDIIAGNPYTLRSINYQYEDTSLRSLLAPDSVNSLLKPGDLFDVDDMQAERARIETFLRNRGYFNFNREYIYYEADSSLNNHQVDLTIGVKKYILPSADGYYLIVSHRKYKIEEVYIYPGFDPKRAIADNKGYIDGLTSFRYNEFEFRHDDKLKADPGVISQSVFIMPGEAYDAEKVKQSYKHLSSLRIYKLVNIVFEEKDPNDPYMHDDYPLICHIQLSPTTSQSYTVELEGTNSAGNLGVGGNLNYTHRNLFGGAENFTTRLSGAVETIREIDQQGFGNMIELGLEGRLTFPKFLLPFKTEKFIRKYNPKTSTSIRFNYQHRPDYTRTMFQTTFGYNWTGGDFITHIINPISLNFVKMIDASDEFLEDIKDTYLEFSFEDRLILGTNYSFIYTNQDIQKTRDFVFFRTNLESAGLLLKGVARAIGTERDSLGRYIMFGNAFAQYVKGDVEFRYFKILNDKTNLVYRVFLGGAFPYGNSITIPYEKQYFTGGANGIRAWQVRNLGPGSYNIFNEPEAPRWPNQTADIKIEGNIEYRFDLFWLLEGALFMDGGNIWSMKKDDDRPGSVFEWNRFYKEFALGAGLGLRMDFSFFVFRFDLGMKVRDPSQPEGSRWVFMNSGYTRPQYNIAIGYPF
jgi:outer membrane protein assembly factor BamA